MRYLRIFLLQFQEVLEDRSRITVWFLLAAVTPLILLLFWRGASHINGWTSAEITSYYLFAIAIFAGTMCHHEEKVGITDIQAGGLTMYLLKPFSYIKLLFLNEIVYRMLQGTLGFVLLGCLVLIFPNIFAFTHAFDIFFVSCLIFISAFMLTFIFKTVVGLLGFWMTETRGAFEAVSVLIVIFSGVLMPLVFLPSWMQSLTMVLPFSYMLYFPVIAFEGKLTMLQCGQVLLGQLIWMAALYVFYRILWKYGIEQYTGVGQ
ncbi:MAG TPA: ABC-2 family transporter protein [Candidatus Sulfotelmatobacter sp.]|jgi:ABC-2 type transport system permease protein|nr:ABC-2 family transporter protein [Candidatus Sulfotelmatobacter sp.]